MSKYSDIIRRLEEATGPDNGLSRDILVASGRFVLERRGKDRKEWLYPAEKDYCREDPDWIRFNHVSKSLDAAIALVERMLPGWFWRVGRTPLFEKGWAHVSRYDASNCDRKDEAACADGKAATPAIALLIAMFRALEAQEARP